MKNTWNHSEVLNQYINSGYIIYKACLKGDYKTDNKEAKIIIKLFKYLEKNLELAKKPLPLLFEHENVVTRTKAAEHCLSIKINVLEAEKILEVASKDQNNGVLGLNAEKILKILAQNRSFANLSKAKNIVQNRVSVWRVVFWVIPKTQLFIFLHN